jgi:hypothetical protein
MCKYRHNVSRGHQKYFGKTQQSKLVKTRRDSAEVHAECSVCVFVIDGKDHDQNTTMIAWQDQKINSISGIRNKDSISKFWIPGVGGVKSRDSSSQESRSVKM